MKCIAHRHTQRPQSMVSKQLRVDCSTFNFSSLLLLETIHPSEAVMNTQIHTSERHSHGQKADKQELIALISGGAYLYERLRWQAYR